MLFVEISLWFLSLALLVPMAVLFVECAAALLPARRLHPGTMGLRPRTAVIVPAHNESTAIGACLASLRPQLGQGDRVLVIADNCDDDTAAAARACGATVVERREPLRSGKGYALNHGLQALRADPPDVLVIIDADCVAEAGLIDTIGRLAIATDRPVQAAFLVEPPVPATANDRLSALAFTVKNLVRPRGLERLGLPCLLTGAGTAIPWAAMSSTTINGAASAEDMRLTAQLACLGHLPMHCHSARVTAGLSAAPRGGVSLQRTRWEHGHLETLLTEGPRLLSAAMRQRRAALLALALELCVPPLSLLVLLWAAAFSAALIAGLLGASMVPAALLALCGLLLVLGLSAAWIKFGRHVAPLRLVLAWPFYVLAKVPLYVAFLTRRQSTWAPRQ